MRRAGSFPPPFLFIHFCTRCHSVVSAMWGAGKEARSSSEIVPHRLFDGRKIGLRESAHRRSHKRLSSIVRSCSHKATGDAFPAEGVGTIDGGRGRGDEDIGTTPIVRTLLKAVIERTRHRRASPCCSPPIAGFRLTR